jgi:hypothetical protein
MSGLAFHVAMIVVAFLVCELVYIPLMLRLHRWVEGVKRRLRGDD